MVLPAALTNHTSAGCACRCCRQLVLCCFCLSQLDPHALSAAGLHVLSAQHGTARQRLSPALSSLFDVTPACTTRAVLLASYLLVSEMVLHGPHQLLSAAARHQTLQEQQQIIHMSRHATFVHYARPPCADTAAVTCDDNSPSHTPAGTAARSLLQAS